LLNALLLLIILGLTFLA